jgi:hypothetical protein
MHPNIWRGMIGMKVDSLYEPARQCSSGMVDTILLLKGIATVARVPAKAGRMRWWAVVSSPSPLAKYQRKLFLTTKSVVACRHHRAGTLAVSTDTLLCCLT